MSLSLYARSKKTIRRIIRVSLKIVIVSLSELSLVYADKSKETRIRNFFLRLLGMKIGSPVIIDTNLSMPRPEMITIGDFVLVRENCHIDPGVVIKDYATIARNVNIYTGEHIPENMKYSYGAVEVGEHVWVGANVIILPGVSIGDHAVVAAGAVVTKDIPAYKLYGGVPAKEIRDIEKEEIIYNQFGQVSIRGS